MILTQLEEFYYLIQNSVDPIVIIAKTAVISLLLFYSLRHLFIGNLFRMVKKLDKDLNKSVRKNFFRQSWIGWIFFLIGLAILEILSLQANWLIAYMNFYVWVVIVLLLFFIGIYFHLYVFTRVIIKVIQKRIDMGKN